MLAAAVLLATAGCGGAVVRLTKKGEYDEAIAKAEAMRSPPRGRAARSLATALSERGRHEQARGVLLADFRHGGDLRSLVALADLERTLGLDGIAASHYARAVDLQQDSLRGRADVCPLLRRRAAVWAAEGAGLAAERDLERARIICGEPTEPAAVAELQRLRALVDASAQGEVDARVARSQCGDGCEEADGQARRQARQAALERARKEGPEALRDEAARQGVQLPAEDVAAILVADARGRAGEALMTDDEVRGLVGEQRWTDLAPAVMSSDADLTAYAQLRLAAVMSDVPVTLRSRTGPGELDVWLARATEAAGEQGWRVLAWAGDVTGAELALSSQWRPRRAPVAAPSEAAGPSEPATTQSEPSSPSPALEASPTVEEVEGVTAPEHWTSRVEPTPQNLGALLLEGRLRTAAGQGERGLEIQRYVGARALARGTLQADARVADEAAWHLAHGRPWQAWAVASVSTGPQSQRVVAAAGTALRLAAAFCGGACQDDADRELVERTLGEAWVVEHEAEQVAVSQHHERPGAPIDACPTLGELLAPDATGPLSEALKTMLDGAQDPRRAVLLRRAIESDVGLGCAGRYVVPLMREHGFVASADALAEVLAHEATLEAPRALTVHAALAMVAGREQQASLLATAAGAASQEPARTWRDLARHAHATGQRELSLRGLREALMHTPGLHDPALEQALVLVGLAGIDRGWSMRETAAGADEPAAHVADLVARVEPARRFAVREQLARALAEQPWVDADARQRLAPALWPSPELEQAHAIGRAWVGLASGSPPALGPDDVGPMDLAAQTILVTLRRRNELAPGTEAFVDPAHMEALRLAVARHSRTFTLRWRMAIGLAAYGSPRARAQAATVLLEMAEPAMRKALLELLLEDLAVIEPGDAGDPAVARVREAVLLATPEDQLTVVFTLPPDPLGL
ncbi:hypothetical protein [Paraliomyxa miuraensis]|uniref:hypothetical protein n=1 Tax=Paraliomyxa miuraensis TaxID=376150 RepID=UPI0022591846|nr:hypothetical protein [Paraliomyxa miuraensis]MCX4245825.1 hypothetical protein [Paraliomyxa miuraensis]